MDQLANMLIGFLGTLFGAIVGAVVWIERVARHALADAGVTGAPQTALLAGLLLFLLVMALRLFGRLFGVLLAVILLLVVAHALLAPPDSKHPASPVKTTVM